MSVALNPYLSFRGTAKEAMEFYQSVFGGELTMMTFADQGGMGVPEAEQSAVMHSQIVIDDRPFVMGADVPSHMELDPGVNVRCSLSGDDEGVLTGWWQGLCAGAQIETPLEKAPWGDSFGMLVDRYGIGWMVNISGAGQAG